MDIIKVVSVFDFQTNVFGILGILCIMIGLGAIAFFIQALCQEDWRMVIATVVIFVFCGLGLVGCDAVMNPPEYQYNVIITDMAKVSEDYDIISMKYDGTYIIKPKGE